jgi:hypothetical protein
MNERTNEWMHLQFIIVIIALFSWDHEEDQTRIIFYFDRVNIDEMADQKEFSKIRHEVYKFGLQGLDKKDRVNARYEQAIKLGAKSKSWIEPHNNLGEQRELRSKGHKEQTEQEPHSPTISTKVTKLLAKSKSKVKAKAKKAGKSRGRKSKHGSIV